MSHCYYIRFQTSQGTHTRSVTTKLPIEYETDIEAVQKWAAKEVNSSSAVLLSWVELKGQYRPEGSDPGAGSLGLKEVEKNAGECL